MKQQSSIRIVLLALLFLLTQSMLLIHASEHDLHDDAQATCNLCLVADNLNSTLPNSTFDFGVPPITAEDSRPYLSYIASFKARSSLPRAPPVI